MRTFVFLVPVATLFFAFCYGGVSVAAAAAAAAGGRQAVGLPTSERQRWWLRRRFGRDSMGGMDFEDWHANVLGSGGVIRCRTHRDCDWIDPRLFCQPSTFFALQHPWFPSPATNFSTSGYCSCPVTFSWSEAEASCGRSGGGGDEIVVALLAYAVVVSMIAVLFLRCLCCSGIGHPSSSNMFERKGDVIRNPSATEKRT